MPLLRPISLMYFGDLYRFYIVQDKLPCIELDHVDMFEGGFTHSTEVPWEELPLELKTILLEVVAKL